jgi:DNA polymerase iota
LIHEAKKICPDVVIVLGEELGRFRDASKMLYKFLESYSWSGKVERLGFDEVFMDMTDIVDYNQSLLNQHDLSNSFFQLNRNDPTVGFAFDASTLAGHSYPGPQPCGGAVPQPTSTSAMPKINPELYTRLILGSHLAQHLRLKLEEEKGYTSTVGISTNKLLSKLVGNLHKPKAQTTLLPPYEVSPTEAGSEGNVTKFMDGHDIGKVPGIGFKMSQRIRNHVLSRPAEFDDGLIYGATKELVTVRDVRLFPDMSPGLLEKVLGGPGAERGIGGKAWALINGCDDTEVKQARKVPTQISIEDSYLKLDTMAQVLKELRMLGTSLLNRMHEDLLEDASEVDSPGKRWIAYPKTIRLSTRPRPPLNTDGTRSRSFNRISRSAPLPNFVFSLKDGLNAIVERLIQEILVPMFRKLHPPRSDWNLSLLNIGVTNMVEAASEDGASGGGRDIGRMFLRQEAVLKEWKVADRDVPPDPVPILTAEPDVDADADVIATPDLDLVAGSEDVVRFSQTAVDVDGDGEEEDSWNEDSIDVDLRGQEVCAECGAMMPAFAMPAHERFHSLED